MKRSITAAALAALMLVPFAPAGGARKDKEKESVKIIPVRTLSADESRSVSIAAGRILYLVADARGALYDDRPGRAAGLIDEALDLSGWIRSSLPTARIKYRLRTAKAHIRYESPEQIMSDLVPVYGLLEEIGPGHPAWRIKPDIDAATHHLRKKNKKEARAALEAAETALVYTEIELPLDSTQENLRQARRLLAAGDTDGADAALARAEDGVQFLSIGVFSPIHAAKRHIADAIEALEKDVRENATQLIRKAEERLKETSKFSNKRMKNEVEFIAKRLAEVRKGTKKGDRPDLGALYLAKRRIDALTEQWLKSLAEMP